MPDPAPRDLHGCFVGDRPSPRPPAALPERIFALGPPGPVTAAIPAPAARVPRDDGSSAKLRPSTELHANRRPSPLNAKRVLPQIGAVVDKYRIDAVVGAGGFAVVYRATHLLLRVPVAIKLLKPEIAEAHPAQAEQLCEEARFAAQVNHPNVVRVFDVTHTERITYIVMELVDGAPLSDAFHAGAGLPPREVVRIAIDVVQGLKAALAQGMIHRDIRPANILLTRNGIAKIVDLGLACQTEPPVSGSRQVVGTPNYMAPEQAVSPDRVDFRSDLYALGVTLYHAATGRLPFHGDDPVMVITRHLRDPVPPPSSLVPGFPAVLERILLWLMAKDPASRPASHDQLLDALREADHLLALDTPDGGQRHSRSGLMDRIRTLFTAPR